MSAAISRVALVGPMGLGMATLLQTLCGSVRSTVDAPTPGRGGQGRALSPSRPQFGEIDLGGGHRLQLCACPGTQRLDFVRRWVLSASVGVFIMVDVNAPEAVDLARALLAEAAAQSGSAIALVLSACPATAAARETFGRALADGCGGGVVPVLQVDPANRLQLLEALSVLACLLALQQERVLPI